MSKLPLTPEGRYDPESDGPFITMRAGELERIKQQCARDQHAKVREAVESVIGDGPMAWVSITAIRAALAAAAPETEEQ